MYFRFKESCFLLLKIASCVSLCLYSFVYYLQYYCDFWFLFFWGSYCSISTLEVFVDNYCSHCILSCSNCIVCPSIYGIWLPFWYLVAIALYVLPRSTTSDNLFGFLWPLYCLSFLDLRLMITHLVSCDRHQRGNQKS
jgi:hypothetical protein